MSDPTTLEKHPLDDDPEKDPKKKAEGEPGDSDPKPKTEEDPPAKSFTQKELDAIVKDRLERQKASLEGKANSEAKKKLEAELKEQKRFEDLAEARQEALDEATEELNTVKASLKEAKAELESYRELAQKQLEGRLEGLPGPLKKLLEDKTPLEVLNYLEDNAEDLAAYSKEADPENNPVPIPMTPKSSPGKKDDGERKKKAISARQYI